MKNENWLQSILVTAKEEIIRTTTINKNNMKKSQY